MYVLIVVVCFCSTAELLCGKRCILVIDTAGIVCSRVCVMVRCPSVCLSQLSSTATCCGLGKQEISIDCCMAGYTNSNWRWTDVGNWITKQLVYTGASRVLVMHELCLKSITQYKLLLL